MEINKYVYAGVAMICEQLTNDELAVLYNVAYCDFNPHNRLFDYEKVKGLFTENDGMSMHEDVKDALGDVVSMRLSKIGEKE